MWIETRGNIHGSEVFVSFERTDFKQIIKMTFYVNRFSILSNDSLKAMGRFRIQLLLSENTWSTRYFIPKEDRHRNSATDWTIVSLIFNVKN